MVYVVMGPDDRIKGQNWDGGRSEKLRHVCDNFECGVDVMNTLQNES